MTYTVGLLHPGSMGAAFGAQLRARGQTVLWCPDGRSDATRLRAEGAGLEPAALTELVFRCDVLLSLCPPAAAEQSAADVAAVGKGADAVYVEANAIAPSRAQRIAGSLAPMPMVDAAVVGSPPVGGKAPTLYLSGAGEQTAQITELFAGTDVRTIFSATASAKPPR
jgi:3-hydroxyisobutyrate dehydrogenase-like beta-hydroxyacid dehydrogenase